jgi:transposase
LPPGDHPELLGIPRGRYGLVDAERFPGLSATETRTTALGSDYRVVVTHSDAFHAKQSRGFDQTLAKAIRQLTELADRLGRGKTRKDRAGVEAEIASITRARWVSRVITTTLNGSRPSNFTLTFVIDTKARKQLEDELFGKRVLFTDRENWTIGDVVGAYRSQHHAESDFAQMKDRKVVSFNPMFHWTDDKIRVHVFYCVLALAVARLMCREAKQIGLDMIVRRLLSTLGEIEETVLLYQGDRGRPRARRMLTEMDPTQERLYDLFGLAVHAPKR